MYPIPWPKLPIALKRVKPRRPLACVTVTSRRIVHFKPRELADCRIPHNAVNNPYPLCGAENIVSMPPRKSTVSAPDDDTPAPTTQSPASNSRDAKDDALGVEDLNLPKSIVQRLAKGVLPANTQIQKDALLAMSKSATVFVNYLTSHAAEHALQSGKKTVMPKDVFDAMNELEFSFMIPRLEAEVAKFTSIQADKRNTYRKKVRDEKKGGSGAELNGAANGDGESTLLSVGEVDSIALDQDGERANKRAKVEGGIGAESEGEDGEEEADEVDEEVEDDEIEEDEEEAGDGMAEDPMEEKEQKDEDDEMADGDESD